MNLYSAIKTVKEWYTEQVNILGKEDSKYQFDSGDLYEWINQLLKEEWIRLDDFATNEITWRYFAKIGLSVCRSNHLICFPEKPKTKLAKSLLYLAVYFKLLKENDIDEDEYELIVDLIFSDTSDIDEPFNAEVFLYGCVLFLLRNGFEIDPKNEYYIKLKK